MRKIQMKDAKAKLSTVVDQAAAANHPSLQGTASPRRLFLVLPIGSDYRAYRPLAGF